VAGGCKDGIFSVCASDGGLYQPACLASSSSSSSLLWLCIVLYVVMIPVVVSGCDGWVRGI
jgi:hypothetical protein